MPRHDYPLTEATIKVINGKAKVIAEEMDFDPQNVYAVLAQTATDPFARFKSWYAACVRSGCDVSHWDNALQAIRERYAMRSGELNIGHTTAQFAKESNDVTCAHIEDKPLYTQLNEVCEAITKAELLKASLIKAINEEKEKGNVRRFGNG